MLNPGNRHLLLDILRPPAGMVFAGAVGTTYTLDLTTLLSVPLYLTMASAGNRDDLMKDGVALLDALRRTTSKIAIFCQHGRIAAPRLPHVLYGMLEPSIVQVQAPHGGVFHPKLWVLRFEDPEDSTSTTLRFIVLSRNLTPDRCWDMSLVIEGEPRGKPVGKNRSMSEFIAKLPSLTSPAPDVRVSQLAEQLAAQLRETEWDELPAGFDDIAFHVLGMRRKAWLPTESSRLVVISPFVTAEALSALAETTETPVALVSRPEEMARLPVTILRQFKSLHVLHDNAETEDGDDSAGECLRGLHAKIYLAERGWYTTLYVGSANATNASLLASSNVDLMVELTGRTSRVGGVDALLGRDGLGAVLTEFTPPDAPPPATLEEQAEDALNRVRTALTKAGLRGRCEPAGEEDWTLDLIAESPVSFDDVATAKVWPVSVRDEFAADLLPIARSRKVTLGPMATASLTGLVAIELKSSLCSFSICFVLNVPVENIPASRDAAVLQTILANRAGFLRYLLLLLQADETLPDLETLLKAIGGSWGNAAGDFGEIPLLEELTRAFSRDPEKLQTIKRLVEQLLETPQGREMVPPEFLDLWQLYEPLIGEVKA